MNDMIGKPTTFRKLIAIRILLSTNLLLCHLIVVNPISNVVIKSHHRHPSSAQRNAASTSASQLQPPTTSTMVKALSFKGDKPKPKKRKRAQEEKDAAEDGPASKQLAQTSADAAEEDENWVSVDNVSDLAGPVMLVFSSEPVMALACDQLGAVFASKVENMVEGIASSAEPHDVRQVFVATRVVGSESDLVLKGCNGRYASSLCYLFAQRNPNTWS